MSDYNTSIVSVTGLRQAAENLLKIGSGELRTRIARDASRAATWVVGDAVKAATYTTFRRQTGWIKSGIGVRVAAGLNGDVLNAVVVEAPQYGGALNPMAALFRKHHPGKAGRGKPPALAQVAFWWRFLEFGTRARRAKRTPSFINRPEPKRLTRRREINRLVKLAAWEGSAGRGAITARPWVRSAVSASATRAVEQYERTMRARTEAEVSNLTT